MTDRVDLSLLGQYLGKLQRLLKHAEKTKNVEFALEAGLIDIENAILAYFGVI